MDGERDGGNVRDDVAVTVDEADEVSEADSAAEGVNVGVGDADSSGAIGDGDSETVADRDLVRELVAPGWHSCEQGLCKALIRTHQQLKERFQESRSQYVSR